MARTNDPIDGVSFPRTPTAGTDLGLEAWKELTKFRHDYGYGGDLDIWAEESAKKKRGVGFCLTLKKDFIAEVAAEMASSDENFRRQLMKKLSAQ